MYRLVVVLMILSLSGSQAASSSDSDWRITPEYSSFLIEPAKGSSAIRWADYELKNGIHYFNPDFSEFEKARKLAVILSLPGEEFGGKNFYMRKILGRYGELESIDKGIDTEDIICTQKEIDKLINLQIGINQGLHEGSEEMDLDLDLDLDLDMDLYLIRRVFQLSEKFFTHCMTKHKVEFDLVSKDAELENAIKMMRLFEIYIDDNEALSGEIPIYCNDKVQVMNQDNHQRLVDIILIKGGKKPVSIEYGLPQEVRRELENFFASTCKHEKFAPVRSAMEFIMKAKRSVRFNREWNSKFDCGENMGRFQLCEEARKRIMES